MLVAHTKWTELWSAGRGSAADLLTGTCLCRQAFHFVALFVVVASTEAGVSAQALER